MQYKPKKKTKKKKKKKQCQENHNGAIGLYVTDMSAKIKINWKYTINLACTAVGMCKY